MTNEPEVILFTSIAEYEARRNFVPALTIAAGDVDRIIGKYELPSDRSTWAKCGVNNCNTAHRLGFVILRKDGLETNIGIDCGERETGETWKEVEATFKRAEDAQARQRTAQALLAERAELLERARAVSGAGILLAEQLGAFVETFKWLNSFWRELNKCAKLGGIIQASLKRNDWSLDIGKKEQLVTIGRFEGGAVLLNGDSGLPALVQGQVIPWLQDLSSDSLSQLDRAALGELVREAGKKRDVLGRAESFVKTSQAFLAAENIAALEVLCDDVLRSTDAGDTRPVLHAWLQHARARGAPTKPVKIHRGKK